MESVISIPQHWNNPAYIFGQRTEQGEIIGMKYYAPDTYLGRQYGEGWRYVMLPDKNQEDEEHQDEGKVKLLTPEQLKTLLQAEIDYYSRQLEHMKFQLRTMPVTVATTESTAHNEAPTQPHKKTWESPPTLESFIDAAQVILKQISQHPDFVTLEYQPDLTITDAQTALSYLNDELDQQSAAIVKGSD
ncbi:hypothetical protein [Anabaena azotica]|uniref:Uncharacterized protein n=1 Tax=Anabaena azotica FACHB-119 TaxID=947527 RepID=A0ABR8DEQ5_9NOST|nr:hypothetical protein [Anabaena azotica]MBD2505121.1 hypothetical protein [Anabaena azotica FACHB-119]